MKILLIEDDEEKSRVISDFIMDEFPYFELDVARSFNSGLRLAIKGNSYYTCLLLDMSMPNFDVTADIPTGDNPESFAGIDLLSQMKIRRINIPTIVVTMFDKFGNETNSMSLDELIKKLETEYTPIFRGLTHYNLAEDGWRTSLKKQISEILNK
ncbi:response regulator transcription factor [Pseudomonas viridiflava]|uniref:response regulator transcription factor n=1 Tax=Pseudomonas viridiflava TaxID=33069 RepID=UPI00106EAD6A|nr:response regulator transcription factor [Pseudomonas viridiflava]